LLRSKSLDSNSYNSGDWFNRLDFSGETSNWAVGLPANQQVSWPFMQPLLANPALKPTRIEIQAAAAHFREMLALRKSSRLFRLRSAEEVIQRLTFYNTGPSQLPGLLVMAIADPALNLDALYRLVVVLINGSKSSAAFANEAFIGVKLELHPILAASIDPIVRQSTFDPPDGAFSIPGRTTAVFVAR
jgi:pullulanase/glycogen debranching enzyme